MKEVKGKGKKKPVKKMKPKKLTELELRKTHEIVVIETLTHLVKNQAEIGSILVQRLDKLEKMIINLKKEKELWLKN